MSNLRQRLDRLERARAKRRKGSGEIAVIVGAKQDSNGNWDAATARKVEEALRHGAEEKYMVFLTGNVDPSRL